MNNSSTIAVQKQRQHSWCVGTTLYINVNQKFSYVAICYK